MVKDEGKVKIKDSISIVDKVEATKQIASNYYDIDVFGEMTYTPYNADIARVIAFAVYFLEGVSFEVEEGEDGDNHLGVNIYDEIARDTEIMNLYREFENYNYDSEPKSWGESALQFKKVCFDAKEIAEFEMNKYLASKRNEPTDRFMVLIDNIVDAISNISKLNIQDVSKDDVATALQFAKKLLDSDITDETLMNVVKETAQLNLDDASKEIIDAKNAEIKELRKYKLLWDSRNVENK